ncbi:Por secretion system C-terminal sorting domain-containing protein [Halpernia humi]|uniref:Por secretion system C-terminal sorting domain-containing protein n=1 Tax=Halpernia humi TaxID=493375 RepID=A0A1H6AP90_9FLAO|nr:T9SS type A sorting domain-containing protein [Halpernia humi]SEG50543.1 Por secretion system C-terminal sorting domain-containing protein [Halpernia humi]
MKKIYLLLLVFLGLIGISAQTIGIYESYAILSINGGTDTFYDMQASTANPDFQGANLGTFGSTESLVIKGGQNKTYKNSGGNVTGGNLYYRVYQTGSPSGTFTGINFSFISNDGGAGNQTWGSASGTTNIISGLTVPGNYTIEIYTEATGYPSTVYSSNSGNNYKATFTLSQTISTSSITGSPFCLGSSISVPYTITGTFNSGNTFTAQLSDASGSFASPTNIGTLASTSSGTISATLPANSLYGTAYKIRVISDNPSIIGTDNGAGLTINAVGFANLETQSSSICFGNNITNGLVTGRVYIGGLTNTTTGENTNIKVEFGYGTTTDPTTGWTWTSANFKEDSGNDDRYTINNFGSALSAGTYKYTFRYRIGNTCEWKYGGYSDGFYNGTTNSLGTLTVTPTLTITQSVTNTEADFVCADGSFIKYTPNVTGGTWSSDNSKVTLSTDPTTYEVTVTGVAMGTPTLTYTLNSCSASKVITVTPAITFANIQLPKGLYGGPDVTVYAQVVAPGATGTNAGAFANSPPHNYVVADLGYSLDVATSNASFASGWTWESMALNLLSSYNTTTNDEYQLDNFGLGLDDNLTYYYVSRFRMKGSTKYIYGGTDGVDSTNSGGILDFTNYLCGILNVQAIVWDGTKWTVRYDGVLKAFNGEPNEGYNVEIAGDTNPPPTFSARKLTINNGVNLVIPALQYVKVVNAIINNNVSPSTATLTVKSDANLIQVNPAAANVGNITAERSVTDMNNITTQMDYVYWSAPVSSQLTKGTSGFSPGTPSNRFFSYRESNDRFYETGDTTFTPGKGYAVRAETGIDFLNGYSKTYKFTGEPNNGNISIPITKSPDNPVGTVHGYNLVGNPYPSNISFDQLYSENSGLIYNTAWFWTNAAPEQYQLGSSYSGNNYAVLNGTGGNHATVPAGVSYNGGTPDGTIKVGQGFLVQATGSGNLNFANDMRISTSGTFFQKGTAVKNRFWLKLISPDNVINSQLIGYIPGATDGFEQNYDAEVFNLSSDLFYSIADGKNLLIQGKSDAFSTDDKIQLGANFFKNGNYTIALDHAEGIFNTSQPIYLKDIETGAVTDLSAKDYTFQATKGISEGRFQIMYKMPLSTGEVKKENVQIYRDGNSFIINAKQKVTDVELYDASGRLILKLNPNAVETKIDVNHFLSGVFILKINLLSGEIVTKKIRK